MVIYNYNTDPQQKEKNPSSLYSLLQNTGYQFTFNKQLPGIQHPYQNQPHYTTHKQFHHTKKLHRHRRGHQQNHTKPRAQQPQRKWGIRPRAAVNNARDNASGWAFRRPYLNRKYMIPNASLGGRVTHNKERLALGTATKTGSYAGNSTGKPESIIGAVKHPQRLTVSARRRLNNNNNNNNNNRNNNNNNNRNNQYPTAVPPAPPPTVTPYQHLLPPSYSGTASYASLQPSTHPVTRAIPVVIRPIPEDTKAILEAPVVPENRKRHREEDCSYSRKSRRIEVDEGPPSPPPAYSFSSPWALTKLEVKREDAGTPTSPPPTYSQTVRLTGNHPGCPYRTGECYCASDSP